MTIVLTCPCRTPRIDFGCKMKKIILSADDFGRSHERNLAIDYSFKHGLIKSAALLVNAKYTSEAVEMAKEGGYVEHLHCHFNIASGEKFTGCSKPLNEDIKKCAAWCRNGDFRAYKDWDFSNTRSLLYAGVMFRELEAQYLRFMELTENKGNTHHVDFHLWDNLRWPVSFALGRLYRKYDIRTVREISAHHLRLRKKVQLENWVAHLLAYHKGTKSYQSDRVNYYVNRPERMADDLMELYVHPDYIDGVLMDNTVPVIGKKKYPLEEHIRMIQEICPCEFISWEEI